jgi:hypothetical protein
MASSVHTQQTGYVHSQQSSGYAPSNYAGAAAISTGAPVSGGYLNADNIGNHHKQYPSQASARYGQDQNAANAGYRGGSEQYGCNNDYAQSTYSCRSLLSAFSTTVIHGSSHRQFPDCTWT